MKTTQRVTVEACASSLSQSLTSVCRWPLALLKENAELLEKVLGEALRREVGPVARRADRLPLVGECSPDVPAAVVRAEIHAAQDRAIQSLTEEPREPGHEPLDGGVDRDEEKAQA